MNNTAKVMEVISQFSVFSYLNSLVHTSISKLVLFGTFPITHAPNFSDPREFVMLNNYDQLLAILKGKNNSN